jgi:serine/threonine protein kinase
MPLSVGQKIGPYEILAPIGAGGMGEGYKAHDPRLDRVVALKIMPPHLLDNSQRRARFQQEARLAAALQHPNVVTIFEIGSSGAADYIAMELVRGRTLDTVIAGEGLGLRESLHYAIQIADALAAAHAAGIVHRDLKPGNIMVTDQRQVKVLDFGLAKVTDDVPITESDATLTQQALVQSEAGTIVGSVAYMSPEQAEGKKVDARSDIFAFGAILYEMLCGRRAFQGESKAATMAAVLKSEPKPLAEVVGGLPQGVDRLVMRCLRKDLSRRAQHISDLKLALEELKEDTESGSAQTPSAAKVGSARGRWLVPAGAAILVLGAAGLWAIMRSKTPAPVDAFEPVPLTTLPGSEIDPSFSPDGTRVVFAWRPEAARNYNVYVQLIGGGPPLRLTNDSRDHLIPTWSPDGKSIAYWAADGSKKTLFTIPSLGGPEREIAQFTGLVTTDSGIAWTPDS